MTVAGLPDHSGERWMRQAELARAMGVTARTVRNWTREGMPSDTWGMNIRVYQLSRCVAWARTRRPDTQEKAA